MKTASGTFQVMCWLSISINFHFFSTKLKCVFCHLEPVHLLVITVYLAYGIFAILVTVPSFPSVMRRLVKVVCGDLSA